MSKILSLLASATEVVCALGFEDSLVGRSHECDYPPTIASLPVCSFPKIAPERPSSEIDKDVKALLEQALSIYRVDVDKLQALRPDVIITQTQCEVCAVSRRDVEAALREISGFSPEVVSLNPVSLADVWRDIELIASALRAPRAGTRLLQSLKARMENIAKVAASADHRPAVACIEWIAPLMVGGNWMPDLVTMAGGRDLFGRRGQHSPCLELAALHAAQPELVLVLPCGFDIPRTRAEMSALEAEPLWRELDAVKQKKVYLLDGNQYFNRPGPRLVESLEILAEIFHPAIFSFGHETGSELHYR